MRATTAHVHPVDRAAPHASDRLRSVPITCSLARRAAQDRRRDPPADPRDGPREFPLECTADRQRTAETRHHHFAGPCSRAEPIGGRNGGHLGRTRLPRLFAVGLSKGTVRSTTSGPGGTLSSIVLPHVLEQHSPCWPGGLRNPFPAQLAPEMPLGKQAWSTTSIAHCLGRSSLPDRQQNIARY
jgi:hypothetical protein